MRRASLAIVAMACLLPANALAQGLPPSLQDSAKSLPPALRAQILERQARLDAMSPDQRTRLLQRVAAWDALPPAEQRARREAWSAWQALPPAERATVRAAASAYAALPADRQQALRARFDALDESERQGWQLGPALGADYPRLHALLAKVPQHQRDQLLVALRAMTPAERDDLAVLAQRTPPQARDELRNALLSTAAHNRAIWLRRQVDP